MEAWACCLPAGAVPNVALSLDDTNYTLLTSATASAACSRPTTPPLDHDDLLRAQATSSVPVADLTGCTIVQTGFNPNDKRNKKKPYPSKEAERDHWTKLQRDYAKIAEDLKDWPTFNERVSHCVSFML